MTCVGFYLEKMQNMSYIGDAVCDKILHWKRPVIVSFIDHVDRIHDLVGYINKGYLRCDLEMRVPKERAIMNSFFRHECATLRKEYAKTHNRVVGPIDTFKSEMSTLEDADRGSVTYSAAMANFARQEEKAREARGEIPALRSRNTNRGRDNRRGNNRQPCSRG